MESSSPDRQAHASSLLLDYLAGSWLAQAISVVAKLGIADLIGGGTRRCSELAKATGADPDALYRVLRALASIGIFAESEPCSFQLTPLAEGLCSSAPGSIRDYAIMLGEDWHWQPWGRLLESVKTGAPAFDKVHGMPLFEYLAQHPDASRIFDAAMTSRGNLEDEAIAAAYDFSDGTIVDVGGGRGSLIAAILQRHPQARGILFDLPHVLKHAGAHLRNESPGGRCQLEGGDFFNNVPAGGDVYVMKKVIHDWDDQRACAILRNCRAAMTKGRLLILEQVILRGNTWSFAKFMDIQMLVQTPGGRERTEAEYCALLSQAGFNLVRNKPTPCLLNVLEAVPA